LDRPIRFGDVRTIDRNDARDGSFALTCHDDAWSLRDGVPFREVLDMDAREASVGVGQVLIRL
jgi:hypothetical protein